MKHALTHTKAAGIAAFLLVASLLLSGLMITPTSASAHSPWWAWFKSAHAEEHEHGTSTKVYVVTNKYIDGAPATSESADGASFDITSSWDDAEGGIGSGSETLELSDDTDPMYEAESPKLKVGADYTVSEVLDEDTVGASCEEEHPFALVGYSTGTTSEAAAAMTPSSEAPSFEDLETNQYVIIWNETCEEGPTGTSTGTIIGEVTGGSGGGEGELAVTSIDAEKTTAIANGTFEDGWRYVFNITVPTDETNLAMKFSDWVSSSDMSHIIPVAGNMRISSEQASATSTVVLTAADTYSTPDLMMITDLDGSEEGIQVQVLVEVAVPAGTNNGTYSTNYGVRTLP